MKKIAFLCFGFLSVHAALSAAPAPIDFNYSSDGTNLQIIWNTYPGKSYAIQSTTNLAEPWSNPAPLIATTSFLGTNFPNIGAAQFFRVVKFDTEGPDIYKTLPLDGGIAVSRQSAVQAFLSDVTGVNSNSIALVIGTNTPINVSDPRLTFTNNVLTYIPATNEFLGTNGQIVSVGISVADTLGNQTTGFTWSFQLELSPVISTNVFFIGAGPPGCSLTLQSTNGDYFTYSYTGASSCLSTGLHLIDTNLFTGYTRTVVSFTQYPASNSVVVLTRPTKLAELLQSGSANVGNFSDLSAQAAGAGSKGTEAAADSNLSLGISLTHNISLEQVLVTNGPLVIKTLSSSHLNLSGQLGIAANFDGFSITDFQATLGATADYRVDIQASVTGTATDTGSVALITPVRRTYGGFIGAVPVWVDLVFEAVAGYKANFLARAEVNGGVQAVKQIEIGERWNATNGWTIIEQNPALGLTLMGPSLVVTSSASLYVYVRPKITLYAYGTAGVNGDLEPYVQLEGSLQQITPPCVDLALSSGVDAHMGLDLRFWDPAWGNLPRKTFHPIPKTALWHTNTCPTNPVIVQQPRNQFPDPGDTVVFEVEAQGGDLTYQWRRNGLNLTENNRVSGVRGNRLRISNVRTNDLGGYSVRVANRVGSTNSVGAELNIVSNGMPLIPAGSFTMGSDEYAAHPSDVYEMPLHDVQVSAFYMDRYEMMKGRWDYVYAWALANGYSFDNAGLGEGTVNPVHSVNWYDAVKWCNARSEKEGRVPAYYTEEGQTNVYRSGRVDVQNDWVKWNAGYRLPTEAEWEKAARGGTISRFSWGETISHIHANYYALPYSAEDGWGYDYDVNPTEDFHPAFANGDWRFNNFTGPVGYFAPNGYGLYEMAGNVREWVWDWFAPYSNDSQTDPRGPATGSIPGSALTNVRIARGGSWLEFAFECRPAQRRDSWIDPLTERRSIGFRCVLPPGP